MQEVNIKKVPPSSPSEKEVAHAKDAMQTHAPYLIGHEFRVKREEQGKSTREIAETLRVSERYIIAIEEMDKANLPERVYALGFVRSYAQFLGFEMQLAVNQFKTEIYGDYQTSKLFLPEPKMDKSRAKWPVLAACGFLVSVILIGWYHFHHKDNIHEKPGDLDVVESGVISESLSSPAINTDTERREVQLDTPLSLLLDNGSVREESSLQKVEQAAPENTLPSPNLDVITLRFLDKTWVAIQKQNVRLISKNFSIGESYSFPIDAGVVIDTSNAGAVVIEHAGKNYILGQKDTKLSQFKLTNDMIKHLTPAE